MKETQRQIQKRQTRAHLIEVALRQFAQNGLTTTRTADIAKAAQVSHGTVFAHFSTQEALLTAVIEEFGTRIARRLHELAGQQKGVREILEAHLKGLTEYEDFYTRLVIEGRLLPEGARNTLIMIQSAISFHLSQAAEQEMKAGVIYSFPVHLLFNTWVGLIHYYLANDDVFAPGESVLKRYGQELLDHYWCLITRKSGADDAMDDKEVNHGT
ncbi:TetR/AcrR family transcriptional regulator [Candidatus Formimonas warabiya]|uniref:TetR family transcriptional regulator n=1 Tax=Formimonas warabiya TaxID=1761012 RepID=A0A3G1KTD5_FORW1|nr:TetR family transcriptional regulator [Candidatus Formimonas warabiya]ATW25728.1 TetR family transcriptional regulator [Candidatus Formimonas warabiya]